MAVKPNADRRKIILLLLLIAVLLILGSIIIDYVGNIFGVYVPLPGLKSIKSLSLKRKIKISEDPYLLEREELSKERERLSIYEEHILSREREILEKENIANQKLNILKEKEKEMEKRAELLEQKENQWKNRVENIREQAVKLYNMPPKDAVAILGKQSESDIVEILRAIDSYSDEMGRQSTSPYLLKLMNDINTEKASSVLRKLKYVSEESHTSVESVDENEIIPEP